MAIMDQTTKYFQGVSYIVFLVDQKTWSPIVVIESGRPKVFNYLVQ